MAERDSLNKFADAILGRVVDNCDMLQKLERTLMTKALELAEGGSTGTLFNVCNYMRKWNNADAQSILEFLKAGDTGQSLLLSSPGKDTVTEVKVSDQVAGVVESMTAQERQELLEMAKLLRQHEAEAQEKGQVSRPVKKGVVKEPAKPMTKALVKVVPKEPVKVIPKEPLKTVIKEPVKVTLKEPVKIVPKVPVVKKIDGEISSKDMDRR